MSGSRNVRVRCALILGVLAHVSPLSAQEREAAVGWLDSAQLPDGSWSAPPGLALRAAAEAFRALRATDPTGSTAAEAAAWLMAEHDTLVDLEARRLIALRDAVPNFVLSFSHERLMNLAGLDGGWGFGGHFAESSALETALALRALARSPSLDGSTIHGALNRLRTLQNADGGFGFFSRGPSSVTVTAEVALALSDVAPLARVSWLLDPALAFVASARNGDGGYGEWLGGPSQAAATALAVSCLLAGGDDTIAGLASSRAFLSSQQLANGSWENDVYVTSLALQVVGMNAPDLAIASGFATPVSVEQGQALSITATVLNRGLSTAPVTVALYAGDPNLGLPPVQTIVLPSPLDPNAQETVTFHLDTAPLLGTVAFAVVADPEQAINELSETNNRRTVLAIVRAPGTLPDPSDNLPPVISSTPPRTVVLGQLYTYQVIAADPEGTPVEFAMNDDGRVPPGMTIDRYSGLLTWLANDRTGPRNPNIIVFDADGRSATQNLPIEVIDPSDKRPPVFESRPLSSARPGALYRYEFSVRDPDGGNVTVALASAPTSVAFDPVAKTIAWTPTEADVGEHIFRLSAVDDEMTAGDQTWIVSVAKAGGGGSVDLTIISVDDEAVTTGAQTRLATGTARIRVANQGALPSPAFKLGVFDDTNSSGTFERGQDTQLGVQLIQALPSGGNAEVDVAVMGTVLFRDNRLMAVADPYEEMTDGQRGNNVGFSGEPDKIVAVQGAFEPVTMLAWRAGEIQDATLDQNVFATPVVANLDDDNGDGVIDALDVPDIIFSANRRFVGDLYFKTFVMDGRTGQIKFELPERAQNANSLAVGDVDGDGRPEIAAKVNELGLSGVALYDNEGTLIWRTVTDSQLAGAQGLTMADLDGDGNAEILDSGGRILNHDGTYRCESQLSGEPGAPTVSDIDLDGVPEIIAARQVLRPNCTVKWSTPYDGFSYSYSMVGQLDEDPEAEVVVSGRTIKIYEHDGSLKRDLGNVNTWQTSGAIGDVDGDGGSEIIILSIAGLTAFEVDGTIRWSVSVDDWTGPSTVPTVADLDGDGRAEVAFMDNRSLRILRGTDGAELYKVETDHGTGSEYPLIADSNGDGRLDVMLLGGFGYNTSPSEWYGIRVVGDPRWAAGRPLWNQYQYHHTNIRCDQKLPKTHLPYWQMTPNAFRAGGEVPRAAREALGCESGPVDLTASYLRVDRSACGASVDYVARIGNGGTRSAPAGIAVHFQHAPPGAAPTLAGIARTSKPLPPGHFEDVRISVPGQFAFTTITVDVDPDEELYESPNDNNHHGHAADLCGVANRQPTLAAVSDQVLQVGQVFSLDIQSQDPDFDPITLALTTAPAGMSLSPEGRLLFVPEAAQRGQHLIAISASDGRGGLAVVEFLLRVEMPDAQPAPPPLAPEGLSLSVTTNQSAYEPGEAIDIVATVTNENEWGGFGLLSLAVHDAAGTLMAEPLTSQEVLFQGAAVHVSGATFVPGALAPGTYDVRALYAQGDRKLEARTSFGVAASLSLEVAVTTDRPVYQPLDPVLIRWWLRNDGLNGAYPEVTTTLEVFSPSGTLLLSKEEGPNALLAGIMWQRLETFLPPGAASGEYLTRLTVRDAGVTLSVVERRFQVSATARLAGELSVAPPAVQRGAAFEAQLALTNAGNTTLSGTARFRVHDLATEALVSQAEQSVALAPFSSLTTQADFDSSAMLVGSYLVVAEVVSGANEILLSAARKVDVTDADAPMVSIVVPPCSAAAVTPQVQVTGAGIVSDVRTLNGQPYGGEPITLEGSYTLVVTVTNISGASASASAVFVVDRTAPTINVSGVVAEGHYAAPVIITFGGTDANLSSIEASLNATPFSSGTQVSQEGDQLLEISALDCAGNLSTTSLPFALDYTPPVVSIEAPTCSAVEVLPVITVNESELQSQSALLNGVPWDGSPIAQEGSNLFTAEAIDRAGNAGQASATIIIDSLPPVVTVTGLPTSGYGPGAVVPVFEATDANLVSVVATLDGFPFSSGQVVDVPGAHTLVVTATDCAGTMTTSSSVFVIDNVAPIIEISAVAACGREAVTPVIVVSDANLSLDVRKLDGMPYDGAPVSAEGSHLLEVVAVDAAGNSSSQLVPFVIDRTEPVVTVTGISHGQHVAYDVSPVFSAQDANLVSVSGTLNGQAFSSGQQVGQEGDFSLSVSAQDCAGNVAVVTTNFVIDLTTPVVQLEAPACTQADVTPLLTIQEPNVASIERHLDGQAYEGGAVSTEGAHLVVVNVTDKAGNVGTAQAAFTIDRTAPSVVFAGLPELGVTNQTVVPQVTVTDGNLTAETVTLNGNTFVSGTAVSSDGAYALMASGVDCAGNETAETRSFLIDKTAPVVSVSAPSCSAVPVLPVVNVQEVNLASDERLLDGQPWTGAAVSAEGSHLLVVNVTDIAGNTASASASFIVDLTDPVITISGVAAGQSYPPGVAPVVAVTDANLVESSVQLNGNPFVSGTPILPPGAYTLFATGQDCSGRNATQSVAFTVANQEDNPDALLVVSDVALTAADEALRSRLEAEHDLDVVIARDADVGAADAQGKAVVVISESTASDLVGTRLTGVNVPMVVLEPALFDDLKMTGTTWLTDFGDVMNVTSVNVTDKIHPLAAGRVGATTVTTVPSKFVWGKPADSARLVASVAGGTDVRQTVFAYREGRPLLDGSPAPARRVGFFPGRDVPAYLNASGWALFDAAVEWARSNKPEALFLVNEIPYTGADAALKTRLEGLGYVVLGQTALQATVGDTRGLDVIVISETVNSSDLGNKFANLAVPAVVLEPALFDDMRMTGTVWQTDFGDDLTVSQLDVSNAAHPLAAALSGRRTISSPPQKAVWGLPAASAVRVLHLVGAPNKVAVFGYEAGSNMVSGTAPARRVGWFAGRDMPLSLTTDGWALFDAAIRWADPVNAP